MTSGRVHLVLRLSKARRGGEGLRSWLSLSRLVSAFLRPSNAAQMVASHTDSLIKFGDYSSTIVIAALVREGDCI